MSQVILKNVRKEFGSVTAVADFSLEIRDGEFMVFVGPSGCGKTTALRMIAGLDDITSGEIYIGERLINRVPPKERDVAMVFQNYALYPHMSVFENMAFGLKLKKVPKPEIQSQGQVDRRTSGHFRPAQPAPQGALRWPAPASGPGPRHRPHPPAVPLRRAALQPGCQAAHPVRLELKKLHERMATTSIYVTHDQIEAMTMGDRIVVMKDGLIQQVGEPLELYYHPTNLFVASFIGSPTMNFIPARIIGAPGHLRVRSGDLDLPVPPEKAPLLSPYLNREIILGIRPEDLAAADSTAEPATMPARVVVVQPVGSQIFLGVKVGELDLLTSVSARTKVKPHQEIVLKAQVENLHFFDPVSEQAIV